MKMSDREYIKKLDDILKFLPKIKDILKIGENKKTRKIESKYMVPKRSLSHHSFIPPYQHFLN